MTLETLANAKAALRVTDPALDAEVTLYLEHASAIVLDYLGTRADPAWDETTAPDVVQAATLQVLANNYEHRGDDETAEQHAKNYAIMSRLLINQRDIGLA